MLCKSRNTLILLVFILLSSIAATSYYQNNTNPSPTSQSIPQKAQYNTEHIIIVDMGSSGTRMHAYEINKLVDSTNNIPNISEIAVAKSSDITLAAKQNGKAIASYSNAPDDIGEHLIPLYKNLSKQLQKQNININSTPIYYFATAGMRLIDQDKQDKIYYQIVKTIKNLGHNNNLQAKTIPGELEGIFDWLSVNYKLKTLQNNQATVAALDMGGASTQVAIEYDNKPTKSFNQNIYYLYFNNKKYSIYSKSILGYGLNQTKEKINDNILTPSQCSISNHFPKTYQPTKDKHKHQIGFDLNSNQDLTSQNNQYNKNNKFSDFNYKKCSNLIKTYLKNKKEHLEIAKVVNKAIKNNMKFLAFSGYYYNFKFFNSNSPEDLIKTIPDSCHSNRKQFKKNFPNLTEEELNETCFDATYLKILLNNGYKIPENYQNFIIPKHDIDWTIGAALFLSTGQEWS